MFNNFTLYWSNLTTSAPATTPLLLLHTLVLNTTQAPVSEEAPENGIRALDLCLALLHMTCFLLGNLGNWTAFFYFLRQRKDLSTIIYILICLTDIVISLLTLPVAVSYIGYRAPLLFDLPGFCTFWGSINTIVPHLSVFMVAVLSITRTHSLVFPLKVIRRRVILGLISTYLVFLMLQAGIPLASGQSKMIYLPEDTYCYSDATGAVWRNMDTILDVIELGFPIIPIIFSCTWSSYRILNSRSISRQCMSSSRIKVNASITIIVFTSAYILFNIPVFVQFLLYIVTLYKYQTYPGPLFSSLWMYYYSWNVVFVLCVALNATINPFIYFCRMGHFKIYVMAKIAGVRDFLVLKKGYGPVQLDDNRSQFINMGTELKSMTRGLSRDHM